MAEFSFAENASVKTLDNVPADFRGLYKQAEDGFTLNSEDAGVKSAVSAITGLNEALKAARAESKGLKGKAADLSALGEYGSTVEEIATGFKFRVDELQGELTKKGSINVDKIKQDIAKAHARDLEAKDVRTAALTTQLYGLMVDNAATLAIADLKGVPELLMPFVREQVKVLEEDGQFRVFVIDRQGDRRYSGSTGSVMTIRELVAEMKATERYARLFESEQPNGTGTRPGSSRPAGGQPTGGTELSPIEKIKAGLRNNRATRGR